jgi:hypothetical protein
MAEALGVNGLLVALMYRGAPLALAAAFRVHRTTAWRDLRRLLGGGIEHHFTGADGELLFTVTCAYRGGPVLSVTDAAGYEIRGAERRHVLRQLRQLRL